MSGKAILVGAILVSQTVEALAQQLIAKYPTGFLSEIVWPCGAAIRTPISTTAAAEAI